MHLEELYFGYPWQAGEVISLSDQWVHKCKCETRFVYHMPLLPPVGLHDLSRTRQARIEDGVQAAQYALVGEGPPLSSGGSFSRLWLTWELTWATAILVTCWQVFLWVLKSGERFCRLSRFHRSRGVVFAR